MAHTNSTANYNLPQWIGTDKPTFLGDFNTAFYDIDAQMKTNADAAASATSTANTAASAATTASTNATTALNTANSAASEAASATSAAASATATANTAATNAATALTASQANNIANLAPAYDPTLTYAVGDLVTYVDTETNTGKLYKCIVAVVTPMEFNINYWDDVTTSEVYTRPKKLIATATASSDTLGTLLNKLNLTSFDINKFYEGEYIVSNSKTILHLLSVTPTEISLIRDIISGAASQQVVMRISASSSAFRWEFATSGNTQLSQTDVSMTDGTIINVYEV